MQANSELFDTLDNLDFAYGIFDARLCKAKSVSDILPILIDMIAMQNDDRVSQGEKSSNLNSRGYSTMEDLSRLQEAVDTSPLSINPSQYEAISEFVAERMKSTTVPKEIELIAVCALPVCASCACGILLFSISHN